VKKSKKVLGILNMGIFPTDILFCNGFAYEEIVKELEAQKCNEWVFGIKMHEQLLTNGGDWCALRSSINEHGRDVLYFYIILKTPFRFEDEDYCKLAHEVLHICQFFLPLVLKRDNEYECEAYLHTHIMRQCLKLMRGK